MKKVGIVIAIVIAIGAILGGFYYFTKNHQTPSASDTTLTEVQKINTKDLEKDYPETPREVVKLFNRIITAYYKETYSEDELETLAGQALKLFDAELQANNPSEIYLASVKEEIGSYEKLDKEIAQSSVCGSNDVEYIQDGDDSLAYVSSSYFIKEGKEYTRTYEVYVLRKDADGNWKILVYYQVDADPTED